MTLNLSKFKGQEQRLNSKIKISETMVEVAATLRKTRSRSQFNLYKGLGLNVY